LTKASDLWFARFASSTIENQATKARLRGEPRR
jgi:hypothetical protein